MTLAATRSQGIEQEPPRQSRRLDVYLVSGDDGFLIEAGPAFADRFRTRPLESLAALPDTADGKPWMVVFDAESQANARAAVAQLEQRLAQRPIIVVVSDSDATDWRLAFSRGTVIDAVPRRELQGPRFAAALAKAEERVRTIDRPPSGENGSVGVQEPRRLRLFALGAAVVLAAAVGVVMYQRSGASADRAAAGSPATAPTVRADSRSAPKAGVKTKSLSVMELLSAARIAFENQKTQLPRGDGEARGDSALELYGQILAQDSTNEEALDGIQRIWTVGRARIQTDIGAGKLEEAAQLLAAFKAAHVEPREIVEAAAAIDSARPRWLATRIQDSITAGDLAGAEQLLGQLAALGASRATLLDLRRTLDAHKVDAQLAGMARDVKAAVDAGALLDPANDNARTRLQAMRQINRTSAATLSAQRDVQAALLAAAQDATQKDQFELAQRLIAAANELAPTAATAEAKKALQAEMDATAQRAAAAAASAKAAVSTAIAAPPVPVTAPVDEFIAAKPARPLNVIYPTAAADANLQGYVVVEFMLQRDGRAAGARVVESMPAKIFDASALAAVSHGRFDTAAVGEGPARRARIKVTFKAS